MEITNGFLGNFSIFHSRHASRLSLLFLQQTAARRSLCLERFRDQKRFSRGSNDDFFFFFSDSPPKMLEFVLLSESRTAQRSVDDVGNQIEEHLPERTLRYRCCRFLVVARLLVPFAAISRIQQRRCQRNHPLPQQKHSEPRTRRLRSRATESLSNCDCRVSRWNGKQLRNARKKKTNRSSRFNLM